MTLSFSRHDVSRLEAALKKIGRLADKGEATGKDMTVVKDFCAEALGSHDFSEAKPSSQSESILDWVSQGDPKVKAYLLAQATQLVHDVEEAGKAAGFVTYVAGTLGAIHAGLGKMESDRGGSKKDHEHFVMKTALSSIVSTTRHKHMDSDEKYTAIVGKARSVMSELFPDLTHEG